MTQANQYDMRRLAIRQAILRDLKLYQGAPVRLEDVRTMSNEPAIRLADAEALAEEWQNLQDFGFVEAVPGFGGAFKKITQKGLEQLRPEFRQDPFIWGPGAI